MSINNILDLFHCDAYMEERESLEREVEYILGHFIRLTLVLLNNFKRPHPLLIFSQTDYLIQIVDINSHSKWQTVQIQIIWLLQKPTDLDLHGLQRQGISGFSRTRVK